MDKPLIRASFVGRIMAEPKIKADKEAGNLSEGAKTALNKLAKEILYDYLRFRHIFRNVYGFKLNWDKMGYLVKALESTQKKFDNQINDFLEFLDEIKE